MMAKVVILAFVAVLCTAQGALAKSSVSYETEINYLDQDFEPRLLHFPQEALAFNIWDFYSPNERVWNTTGILEAISKILQNVQEKFDELNKKLDEAIKSAFDYLENLAMEQAEKWSELIEEWVEKATAAGVDIQQCLAHSDHLQDIIYDLKEDAYKCVIKRTEIAQAAVEEVKTLIPKGEELVTETKRVIDECTASNIFANFFCFARKLPFVGITATRLILDTAVLGGRAAAAVASVPPMAGLCTAQAIADRTLEANRYINETISCIKDKLEHN